MRRIFILIALSMMITSGFAIWVYLNFKSPEQAISESKAEDSHKEDGIIKLNENAIKSAGIVIEDVKKMVIGDYITATGEVRANAEKEAYITPRIPGKAAEANLEKERILYNSKAKILDIIKKGIKSEETITILKDAELGKAKADILKPLARLELGEANLKRERELLNDNISSMKEVIAAEKEYTSAMIEFQTGVEEMFLNAKHELAKVEAEYMSAKARMEERREHFYHYGFSDTEIDEMIDESRKYGHATIPIIAPFKGRIVERLVTVGQVVDTSTKLFKLIDLSTVWVWANIYEKDLGMVKKGQEIFITVTPYPDRVFTSRITYISDTVDPATRIVKVRAELVNPPTPPFTKGGQGGLLKPEMFASVKIDIGRGFSLAVPESAVQREGANTIVFVAKDETSFKKRIVTLDA